MHKLKLLLLKKRNLNVSITHEKTKCVATFLVCMQKWTQILDFEDNCVEKNTLHRTIKSYYILMFKTGARTQTCLLNTRITSQSCVNLKEISLKA